jgi:hypothetical protein
MDEADILSGESGEDRDEDLRRMMIHGPAFGIPIVYVISVVMSLVAGASLGNAAFLSIVPAVVGGPYFGGIAILMHARLMSEAPPKRARHRIHWPHIGGHRATPA